MTQKTRRLGRGLSSLIQPHTPVQVHTEPNNTQTFHPAMDAPRGGALPPEAAPAPDQLPTGMTRLIPVSEIVASPFQPRRHFDEPSIERLASSIRRAGLMQPVIVRRGAGGYELVAGERRLRAARLAGLERIPALVRELSDEESAEWGLVENVQREDLNPIERAHGLRALAERFALSQADLGERVGLDRSTVANLIRLTELEEEIQSMVGEGTLSMGHARALLGRPAGEGRIRLARRAAEQSWSVRRVEEAVRAIAADSKNGTPQTANAGQTQRAAILEDLERRIAAHLGTKARIHLRAKGNRGQLVVEFFSLEHFEDVMQRIGLPDGDSV